MSSYFKFQKDDNEFILSFCGCQEIIEKPKPACATIVSDAVHGSEPQNYIVGIMLHQIIDPLLSVGFGY